MNYPQDAFNGFDPQVDHDAAVKLTLSVIFMNERLNELSSLLTDGHEIGGLEGEPGWIIERRDAGPPGDHPYFANWPTSTHFHAHVDPRIFQLAFPDVFMETHEFYGYVLKAVDEYLAKNPADSRAAELITSQINKSSSD